MKIDQSENLIWRYLLGELAEAEQTALEQELLIDRGKFDQVCVVFQINGEIYVMEAQA